MERRNWTLGGPAADPVVQPETRPLALKVAPPIDPRGQDPLPRATLSLSGTGSVDYQERPPVRGMGGPSP